MRQFILILSLIAVAVVFSGCDDLLADPPKPKEKTLKEVVEVNEYIMIRNSKHSKFLLCEDGLEYIVLTQVKALALTPHWIVKDGVQQIKTCK